MVAARSKVMTAATSSCWWRVMPGTVAGRPGAREGAFLAGLRRFSDRIRVRAERRLGEILKRMAETGERATRESPKSAGKHVASGDMLPPPTLENMGIPRDRASRAMQLAEVPQEEFDAALAAVAFLAGFGH